MLSSTTSSRPISALDSPRAINRSTSASRAVNRSKTAGTATGRTDPTNEAINRRVSAGSIMASPAAATPTAAASCSGGQSLSRNPLALSRSASYTYSSVPNVVSTTTRP